jgi:hypothetical protein
VGGAQALADEAGRPDEAGRVRRPREVNKVNKMEAGNLPADADEDCLAAKAA